jgi:hypothetical protein
MFSYMIVSILFEVKKGQMTLPFHLVTYFCQRIFITLQKMQAFFILSWVIAIGLTTLDFHFKTHPHPHYQLVMGN